jgi:hypothetical protein
MSYEDYLSAHKKKMIYISQIKKQYKCNTCNETFIYPCGLTSYLPKKQYNPLICICPNCGKNCSRNNRYQLQINEERHININIRENCKRKLEFQDNHIIKDRKINKTLFEPKIISGIMIPKLPNTFRPIPDYNSEDEEDDEDNKDDKYDGDEEEIYNEKEEEKKIKFDYEYNLHLLADVTINCNYESRNNM